MYIYRKFLAVHMLCPNNMLRTARLLQLVGYRCAAFCQQHPPTAKSRDKLRLEKKVNLAVSVMLAAGQLPTAPVDSRFMESRLAKTYDCPNFSKLEQKSPNDR
jgi:hypothetical protein